MLESLFLLAYGLFVLELANVPAQVPQTVGSRSSRLNHESESVNLGTCVAYLVKSTSRSTKKYPAEQLGSTMDTRLSLASDSRKRLCEGNVETSARSELVACSHIMPSQASI